MEKVISFLKEWGMNGNGKIELTEKNKEWFSDSDYPSERTFAEFRAIVTLRRLNKNIEGLQEVSRKQNEYGNQDIKFRVEEFEFTVELNEENLITHCYY